MTAMPTLTTDRLVLRPYARADFGAYAAFVASDRSKHMGGPFDTDKAWTWFTNDIASWHLYGFGSLAIVAHDVTIGFAGLVHPPDFFEPECGWVIYDGHEGHGFATEAARMILDHTFATTDLDTIVSYIGTDNAASASVARHLGARIDTDAPSPFTGSDVWRHRRPA